MFSIYVNETSSSFLHNYSQRLINETYVNEPAGNADLEIGMLCKLVLMKTINVKIYIALNDK